MPYIYVSMLPQLKNSFQRAVSRICNRPGRVKQWGYAVLVVFTIIVFSLGFYLKFITTPEGNGRITRLFDFSSGYTLKKIAAELAESGIIGNATLFTVYARLERADQKVQAGTYLFSDDMSPAEILSMLVNGTVYQLRFAVPEGYSIFQIAELLEKQDILPKDTFLKQCYNASLLHELGIHAKSVEGFLSPRTYVIKPGTDAAGLVKEMVTRFRSTYDEKFAERARSLGFDEIKVLTLASMIEKEAVIPAERPLIASVFLNRLKKNMPLQSDPTSVYGIRAFAGKISKQDILRDTPYNTYRIGGLPPGPIGNPGEAAIEAVLLPSRTPYLYFVAKKDGSHHFSTTLEEHNRAVARYLKPSR